MHQQLETFRLSLRNFATDHHGRFPDFEARTNGGSLELARQHQSLTHYFLIVSNELFKPSILICPSEAARQPAQTWASLTSNSQWSHFVSLDADGTRPRKLLAGDRNILMNRTLSSNQIAQWTTNSILEFELNALHRIGGDVAQADGAVQQLTAADYRHHAGMQAPTRSAWDSSNPGAIPPNPPALLCIPGLLLLAL